jgi:hypothetical protein
MSQQHSQQQCHNSTVTTSVATTLSQQQCHNSVTTTLSQQQCRNNTVTKTLSQQQCHNNSVTTTVSQQQCYNNSVTTTVSQLKICDFSGETFKDFEVLYFSVSATTTQPLSSGEFCKLHYDTIPVKSASANVSLYTNKSKMPNFVL